MFLMFRLHRPDVLPAGDLGIVKAMQRAYGLRQAPSPERMRKIAEPWRPYRSVASWYLWRSLSGVPGPE
jgi:DNA-3-methyladenine glycosylase II